MSDLDHYQKEVKKQNFIKLFLQGMEVDRFITTHLYGDGARLDGGVDETVNESIGISELKQFSFEFSQSLDQSLIRKRKKTDKDIQKIQKMSAFEAYIALIKGYCASVFLVAPK